ncbi:hypothetical protein EVJ58_g8806 [Rhodofomes roseus]|uniref:Carboxylic ester hydrolase n=1 Tax=Rhodofomes roseus TaxID=34475 RepID=A0A4Y9XZH6_9APHY|nr:hypothetical protein EVJ58_g8806 [Rhodofomes roseus]
MELRKLQARLLSTFVLTSLIVSGRTCDHIPTLENIGSVDIFYPNDHPNDFTSNATTGALLINTQATYAGALVACARLSEQVLPQSSLTNASYPSLLTLLYERSPLNAYWVNGSDSSGGCIAYVKRAQGFASVDCSSELPILCTQTAAPFTIGADDPSPPASSVPDAYKTIVSSEDLTITGFRDARTFRFLGIPYAVPPVGALRFEPSQAYNGSNNVSALTTGASCMQPYFGIVVPGPRQSEDCLFLNIFTPSLRAADIPTNKGDDETRPVIFWIHGGAYVSGAASHLGSYDRLGSLGSFASPFLLVGNQTLSDQILALEWVQKYISAFGGDPTRVTIMGESAGAASVGALISSPAAKGLFHAATMESFPVGLPWYTRSFYSEWITPVLADQLNCSITDEAKYVSCLRALPESAFATDVIVYFSPNQSVYNGQPLSEEVWLPSINATMLLGQLNDLLDNGTLPSPVPIMMGTMEDDGTLFLYDDVSSPLPESDYDNLLFEAFGGDLATTIINSTLFPLNTSDPDTVRNTVSYIITLYTFKCPTLQIARKLPNTTYLFEFRRGLPREGLPTVCTPQSPGR